MTDESKRPIYTLVLTDRANKKRKTYAGVIFAGQFGSLSIVLNPGITIDAGVAATCWINAIPYESKRQEPQVAVASAGTTGAGAEHLARGFDDDDIPF